MDTISSSQGTTIVFLQLSGEYPNTQNGCPNQVCLLLRPWWTGNKACPLCPFRDFF